MQNAYERAVYRIFHPQIEWMIGTNCTPLDRFLHSLGAANAVFLTASNPVSRILSNNENELRNTELEHKLTQQGYPILKGQGEDPTGTWPPEASFLVPEMTLETGRALGRAWGQNALVWIEVEQVARLVACRVDFD